MEPSLNRAPPLALERVVTRLIPPAAREEVAGDLWERFRSSWLYVAEAAVTLLFVVASQMRRATSAPVLLLEAYILFASLGGFEAAWLTQGDVAAWQRALLPTGAGLLALLLRDAYRTTDRWTAGRAGWDILAVSLAIAASQLCFQRLASIGAISADWRLPPIWLYGGTVLALMITFILRTGVDLVTPFPPQVMAGPTARNLEDDYRRFAANVGFKNWTENGALAIMIPVAFWFDWHARPVVATVGYGWIAITLALIAYNLTIGRPKPLPHGTSLPNVADFYRAELARQCRAIRFVWWWYFIPLFAGLITNLIAPGLRDSRPLLAIAGFAFAFALAATIDGVNRGRRRQLEDKITQVSAIRA